MKYEDPLVLEENEVHKIILDQMQPNSSVLEFGAAGGRFTRILKESYNCRVYIIEIDTEGYKNAMEYADYGLCCDIENLNWTKKISGKFDYILFVDVLEHTRNPKEVLASSALFLKNGGSTFISVPNIAHNDVWIKLGRNRFDYTDIGILDDTHLRFFTMNSLPEFVRNTGYAIVDYWFKYIPTGMTEQCVNAKLELNRQEQSMVRRRADGEIYQIVLQLKNENEDVEVVQNLVDGRYADLMGWIYFDRGNGFSQEDAVAIWGEKVGYEQYRFDIDMDVAGICRVRLDPIEWSICSVLEKDQNCVIPYLECYDGEKIILSMDPQIIWNIQDDMIHLKKSIIIGIDNEKINATLCRLFEYKNNQEILLKEKISSLSQQEVMECTEVPC